MSGNTLQEIVGHNYGKIKALREQGIDPYPRRFQVTHSAAEALKQPADARVRCAGRVVLLRLMGKAAFAHIKDGSGKIQIYVKKDAVGEKDYETFKKFVGVGDFLGVEGKLFVTKTGELTVAVDKLTILSKSVRPLPEKWHGLTDPETRYRERSLDLISNDEVRRIFVNRARIVSAVRQILDGDGYLEVETPVLCAQAGGASARPFVTFHNVYKNELYMRIATELPLKKLIIGGFDGVYEIGRIFRNEGVDTSHNPEFTSLEAYKAYGDYNTMAELAEKIFARCSELTGVAEVDYNGMKINLRPPFRRVYLPELWKERTGRDIHEVLSGKSFDREALRAQRFAVEGLAAEHLVYVAPGPLLPELRQVDPAERGPEVYLHPVVVHFGDAGQLGAAGEDLLGQLGHGVVVAVGLVGLQRGELGVVAGVHALVAEDAADLVDAVETADDELLERQFGGDAHVELVLVDVVEGDERPRGGAAGLRAQHRRLDLEVAVAVEDLAHRGNYPGAVDEDPPDLVVGDEVQRALAVAGLGVGQAVPLLRQGPHGLGKDGQLVDGDGQLAGLCDEKFPFHAQKIPDADELLEGLVVLLADGVLLDVDLYLAAAVLDMGEGGLSHEAQQHHAAGAAHPRVRGLLQRLGRGMGHLETARVGVYPLLAEGLDLAVVVADYLLECVAAHRPGTSASRTIFTRFLGSKGFSTKAKMFEESSKRSFIWPLAVSMTIGMSLRPSSSCSLDWKV